MQTATPFRWLAALVLWLGPLLAAHATHILGGELTYKSVASTTAGVPRYHISARIFRDPMSTADLPVATIFFLVVVAARSPTLVAFLSPLLERRIHRFSP